MRRIIIIPAVLLVAALSLAGCSARSGSSSSASDAGGSAASGAISEQAQPGAAPVAGSKSAADSNANRDIVTTGSVSITADNPAKASDRAVTIAEDAGGRVDGRAQSAGSKTRSGTATLQLRIPATALTQTLKKLKELGRLTDEKLSSSDVTTESNDLDAQITALTTSVNRLLQLEAKASDTDVLIKLETAISDRQGQLDSLTSQRRLLKDQIAMSTISVVIESPDRAPVVAATTFWDALGAGFVGFGTFLGGVLILFGYLVPWLIFAGVVLVVVLFFVRRRRRRRPSAEATERSVTT